MENKPASLLVVLLGKALNETPAPFYSRQMKTSLERRWAPLNSHKLTTKIFERAASVLRLPDDLPVMGWLDLNKPNR